MTVRDVPAQPVKLPALARSGETLSGTVPLHALTRLAQGHQGDSGPVTWQASAEWHARPAAAEGRRARTPDIWLSLKAQAVVRLICQRCLEPTTLALDVDRRILFVESEARAQALDEEMEEDVLSLDHPLDLLQLVEDELVLALPIIPLHAQCTAPSGAEDAASGLQADVDLPSSRAHPFAALAALKKPPRQGSD